MRNDSRILEIHHVGATLEVVVATTKTSIYGTCRVPQSRRKIPIESWAMCVIDGAQEVFTWVPQKWLVYYCKLLGGLYSRILRFFSF